MLFFSKKIGAVSSLVCLLTSGALLPIQSHAGPVPFALWQMPATTAPVDSGWQPQAYLKAPNAGAGDEFGNAVAISGDTVVVGAPREDSNQIFVTNGTTASSNNAAGDAGAAYVFVRTAGTLWTPQAYLKAPNAGAGDLFGWSTSISGDTIVAGAYFEASNQTFVTNGTTASSNNSASSAGAAYVFVRTNGTLWTPQAYLKAPNAETADLFGWSSSIDRDTIVVGARNESSNQTFVTNGTTASSNNATSAAGAAYVFVRTNGTLWTPQAYLKAPNPGATDLVSDSISIYGDTIVAGAYLEDSNQTFVTNGTTASSNNTATDAGAAYVFVRTNGTLWTPQAYLKAPNAEASDQFGYSTSIYGDTIVATANLEDSNQTFVTNGTTASSNNTAADAGAAYVFVRTNGTLWTPQAYLKPPNTDAGDRFGRSASIFEDTIVVGAHNEDSNQTFVTNGTTASANNSAGTSGAAYVFVRTAGTLWTPQAYLKAANSGVSDLFGYSTSISGASIVVGAYGEASNQTFVTNGTTASSDNSAASAGAAYVFARTAPTLWYPEAYLKAPNAEAGDNFGSTAISGDTIVVGASLEGSSQTFVTNGTTASSNNLASGAGAAYVFTRTAGTLWTPQAYIKAPNAESNDNFGYSTSISGDTIVVGAIGESSNQTFVTNGTTASIDNSTGAAGAAYVFVRTNGTLWISQAYLKAPNAEAGDYFGTSVSISGDTIVVGAYAESSNQTFVTNGTTASSNNTAASAGAAYVFVRTNGTLWTSQAYLKAPNAEASDQFGYSTSISGDTIVVGAYAESSNQTFVTNGTTASSNNSTGAAGAAYVYIRTAGTLWTPQAFLKAPNAGSACYFGTSTSISGDTIVVGAHGEFSNQTFVTNGTTASSDSSASFSGAAYVYIRTAGTLWTPQAYIKASNAEVGDSFGTSTSISGDTIVVGSDGESSNQTFVTNGTTASSDNTAASAGAAYLFIRTAGTLWTPQAYLKAPNAEASDQFGSSASISGDTIVVGALGESSNQTFVTNGTTASSDNSAASAGAAYVFKRR